MNNSMSHLSAWLLVSLLALMSAKLAAATEEPANPVSLYVVPRHVYAASDGVAPQWRFLVVAVNAGDRELVLDRMAVTLDRPAGRTRRVQTGDGIRGIVQGKRQVPRDQAVVLDIKDGQSAKPPPSAVELELGFSDARGGTVKAATRVPLERRDTAYLHFPLVGSWGVSNARTTTHSLGIQFGFDLIAQQDFYERPPRRQWQLEEFASFGQPVFAPVDGTVVAAVGDQPDFPPTPGKASLGDAPPDARHCGNYVIIAAGPQEYVVMCHVKCDSLSVKSGDRVREGQQIAQVGNSGNTSQPHLHIEMLDELPDLTKMGTLDFAASGLPFGFKGAVRQRDRAGKSANIVPRRLEVLREAG
jgi:hypothetical protein